MSALRTIHRLATRTMQPIASLLFPPACWVDDAPVEAGQMGLGPEVRESIAKAMV